MHDRAVMDTTAPEPLRRIRRHPLVAVVASALRDRCGVAEGTTISIGVSGGADSSALLLIAAALASRGRGPAAGIRPTAVHVHHHLRAAADAEASSIDALCRRLSVPLRVEHVDPAREDGNLAAAARALRYAALARAARASGATVLAVAHHAGDQLETMLMALGRGAGIGGLAAMSWRRALEPGLDLVRPLLAVPRGELEALCEAGGVTWSADPSNDRLDLARTRLRHEVVPVLESVWPGAAARAGAMTEELSAAAALLDTSLAEAFGPPDARRWPRARLAGLPASQVAAGLRRAALAAAPEIADELRRDHVTAVADATRDDVRRPRTFTWPRGLRVTVSAREVELI
jgi:tRNA(Ile)-lysidine synthetase-like protein